MTTDKGQQVLTQLLPLKKIQRNTGQIPGLPKNPRIIRDARFQKLRNSIKDFPQMLELREVVVYPHGKVFVCIGGNMRHLACEDLAYKEIPAKILPPDYPIERLREFAIKDNVGFGDNDYDLLANEWSEFPLNEWGMEIAELVDIDIADFFEDVTKPKEESFTLTISFKSQEEHDAVIKKLRSYAAQVERAMLLALGLGGKC